MKYSQDYYKKYQHLPEQLAEKYTHLNFDNHCYLRIALDNAFGAKWDKLLKRPAYKNLTKPDLQKVIGLLKSYLEDEILLKEHNKNSLNWRKK